MSIIFGEPVQDSTITSLQPGFTQISRSAEIGQETRMQLPDVRVHVRNGCRIQKTSRLEELTRRGILADRNVECDMDYQ